MPVETQCLRLTNAKQKHKTLSYNYSIALYNFLPLRFSQKKNIQYGKNPIKSKKSYPS
jgi:hypothetical protein